MNLPSDWQLDKQKLGERGQHLLETGQWADCRFIVGQEPQQLILNGHKLFLAMSSPVFEAMFYGGMAEKNDPIPIRDVQPDAFKALLQYIYTDNVELVSFELACELCYCAKKYMLPFLVKKCTKFLWSDLSPKKACRAYEFAKLFEEPILMERCLYLICTKTSEVLKESNWEDIDLHTLLLILDQNNIQIESEIELFTAVERWAKAECNRKSLDISDSKALKSVIGDALYKIKFLTLTPQEFAKGPGMSALLTQDESFAILMNILNCGNKQPMPEGFSVSKEKRSRPNDPKVKYYQEMQYKYLDDNDDFGNQNNYKIRRICSTRRPNIDYSDIPSTSGRPSNLVNNFIQDVMPGIIDNEADKDPDLLPLGNSTPIVTGMGPKHYCRRALLHASNSFNSNLLDSSITFSVDKNIYVTGIQIPSQRWLIVSSSFPEIYTEIVHAHLFDSDGTRLSLAYFTQRVTPNTLVEIAFDRPVYIQKNKTYRVGVVLHKVGLYPLGVCSPVMSCDSVLFTFESDNGPEQDGLIRSIVFTH
ncbi:BTB/POZ domain-containing protein 6 [Prorops nasuta]|uniref:BTB/POZ domain-containing protein 6 n=1 Tax=Prorops nasuta TaxID=863751 RepID=UPI0034CE0B78